MKNSNQIVASAPAGELVSTADRAALSQRASSRNCTVYLIAEASTETDSGLCRVKNISDHGMMVITGLDAAIGGRISITLSDSIALAAEIMWSEDGRVGLRFMEPIDSLDLLQSLADKGRSGKNRPPRLSVGLLGTAATEAGLQPIRTLDISQHGMKISHGGGLRTGVRVKVTLENGLEQRGVVKWSNDRVAGLRFNEPIPHTMLDSVADLTAISAAIGPDEAFPEAAAGDEAETTAPD